VEHVYPLDQFKEAFKHSVRSNRGGKILFEFRAHGEAGPGAKRAGRDRREP